MGAVINEFGLERETMRMCEFNVRECKRNICIREADYTFSIEILVMGWTVLKLLMRHVRRQRDTEIVGTYFR